MKNPSTWRIILLCGFLLTLAGCSLLSKNSAMIPTTAPVFTASADPRADVVKAMRANLDAKSYRMRSTTTSSSGYKSNISAEFVAPDRMHTITETDMPGRSTIRRELIYIGKDSYIRVGDSPWQKYFAEMSDIMAQMRDPKLAEEIAKSADVKYLGTDTLEGAPMLIYQYTIKDLLGPGKDSVSKIWIGATDNMQHQRESENDYESPTTGKTDHSKSTSVFFDYNTDIKIEPPM